MFSPRIGVSGPVFFFFTLFLSVGILLTALGAQVFAETFTINSITSDGVSDRITITFSTPCAYYPQLVEKMRIIPSVRIYPYNTRSVNNNAIEINAPINPGQKYTLVIPKNTACQNLRYSETLNTFTVPERKASIKYADNGTLVELKSRQMIHLSIVNVEGVRASSLRIPPILAPVAFGTIQDEASRTVKPGETENRLREAYSRLMGPLSASRNFSAFGGVFISDGQTFFPDAKRNEDAQFSVPATFRKERDKGSISLFRFHGVSARAEDATGPGLFRITDIAVTYKRGSDSIVSWITSLNSGNPIEGVSLMGYSTRTKEAVFLGTTDKSGVVIAQKGSLLEYLNLDTGKAVQRPLVQEDIDFLVAASADDASFVRVEQSSVLRPDWVEQSSALAKDSRITKGHIFTERGIYRPGETVHFKGTAREFSGGEIASPSGKNASVKVLNSKGEEVFNQAFAFSEFGTISGDFLIKGFYPLGAYTIKMTFGPGKDGTASRTFQVQEFKPPRHFSRVEFERMVRKDTSIVGAEKEIHFVKASISGIYYAGGPVKNGKVRWSIYLSGTDYPRKGFGDFTFGHFRKKQDALIESGESMLDENGKINVTVPLSDEVITGRSGIEVVATVIDFDGKAASETAVYQQRPEYMVGISRHEERVDAGEPQVLRAVALDPKAAKIERGEMTVAVKREMQVQTRKRNEDGNVYWAWTNVWKEQFSSPIKIENGEAILDFDFMFGGNYLVEVSFKAPDGRLYSSSTAFNVYGGSYWYYEDYGHRGRAFQKLPLSPDKAAYAPGEKMRIYMRAPRPMAKLLVTVEREGIIKIYTENYDPEKGYIEIPVDRGFMPNAYVSVLGTVSRGGLPVYDKEFDEEAPAFYFGVAPVEVKKSASGLKVGINEDEKFLKSGPGESVTVRLKLTDEIGRPRIGEIALGVVDESVLALTGYETPNLDTLTRFRSALGVYTWESRLGLLSQTPFGYAALEGLTGGDGLEKSPEAVSSKIRKDFNPVAYFNPVIRTDEKGEAVVSFNVPDTMTTYRIYAVACDKADRFASVQRGLLVVKDFYLEPGLPRFFTVGDTFKFNVAAFNKTEKTGDVVFGLKGDGFLSLDVPDKKAAAAPMRSALLSVEGRALKAGTSAITFFGKMNGLDDAVEMKIPVNSGYLRWNDNIFGTISGRASVRYDFPEGAKQIPWDDIDPDDIQFALNISGSPFLRMRPAIKYLLQYPYGCVEQTSSGVMPLAGLRGLFNNGLIPGFKAGDTDKYLDAGVKRLLSMQNSTGGFGYWPGDIRPHHWGTIYATTALTYSAKAGFDVPKDRMDMAMRYLSEAVNAEGRHDPTFKGFAVYILAMNGKLERGLFNQVYAEADKNSREGAIMTVLAGKISGYISPEEAASRAGAILDWKTENPTSDVFYARYRGNAVFLIAATEMLPESPVTGRMAESLMGGMNKEGFWSSTSDTGWALVALGKYFERTDFGESELGVSIRQAGWPETAIKIKPTDTYTVMLEPKSFLENPSVDVKTDGNGAAVYALSLTYPRMDFAASGMQRGFEIQKRIENTDGSDSFRVGDVVKVTVTIRFDGHNRYVVIDDPLPAGLVAINSAIKSEEHIPREKGGRSEAEDYWWDYWDNESGFYRFVPNYFEMRDDRVLAFRNDFWGGTYQYSYYARAVCEGDFIVPATKVQLMYEPGTVSYTPVMRLRVLPVR